MARKIVHLAGRLGRTCSCILELSLANIPKLTGAVMQKKDPATPNIERRAGERRGASDRRKSMRLQADRRRTFGRRQEDLAEMAALEQRLTRALAEAEALGPDDPGLAAALNDLGVFYYRVNRDAEAEPLHKRALEIQERLLGPTHPDVVKSLFNLAALYYARDRYGDSEALLKRALDILRQARLGTTQR
jgi:tetratricopeptide (TPR) repeat protein